MKKLGLVSGLLVMLFFTACEKDGANPSVENLTYFYENATSVKIDVAYEPGAEPYVNSGFGSNANFDFTVNNIIDLLDGRDNAISVICDKQLSEMTPIPDQQKNSYKHADIREIAEAYQPLESSENQGVVFVIFLDGYFNVGGQDQQNVLGVSIGAFTVALFKPVIAAIPGGGVFGGDPKFQVEQATVVHEIGHALGLVDNGVALHTDHLDEANGKHCDNEDCVMYWANEGAGGASGLFGSSASVTQLVFGQECIDDITNF